MEHDVARLWQRREDREIGGIAGAEIERGFGAEMASCLGLERLVLGVITAEVKSTPARGRKLRSRSLFSSSRSWVSICS
jgi:hypothetical protein